MSRPVDTQRAAERRPHVIDSLHFPRDPKKPGRVTCACGVTVEAFPRRGTTFEDPWLPLSKAWTAHRASVGAPKLRHAGVYGGGANLFTRDNSRPMTKAEAGRLGAAAGPERHP